MQNVLNDPLKILSETDKRYNSKIVASGTTKMSELAGSGYTLFVDDITAHVDATIALIEQLGHLGTIFCLTLTMEMFVRLLDVSESAHVAASNMTLSEDSPSWKDNSNRLTTKLRTVYRDRHHPSVHVQQVHQLSHMESGKLHHMTRRVAISIDEATSVS